LLPGLEGCVLCVVGLRSLAAALESFVREFERYRVVAVLTVQAAAEMPVEVVDVDVPERPPA
jgi:hypothetical protein